MDHQASTSGSGKEAGKSSENLANLELESVNEMFENFIFEELMNNFENVFMLNQNHSNEEIIITICDDKALFKTQTNVEYKADKSTMAKEEWTVLQKWINRCEEKEERPLMPRTKSQEDSEEVLDEEKLLQSNDGNEKNERNEVNEQKRDAFTQVNLQYSDKGLPTMTNLKPVQLSLSNFHLAKPLNKVCNNLSKSESNLLTENQNDNETMRMLKNLFSNTNKIIAQQSNMLIRVITTLKKFEKIQNDCSVELRRQQELLNNLVQRFDQLCNDGKKSQVNDVQNNSNELKDKIVRLVRQELNNLGINKETRRNDGNNKIINEIKEAIKFEIINKDPSTRRDYKLTSQIKYEHFYDYFSSELRSIDLLYVIDSSVEARHDVDQIMKEKHKFRVRDILINRLDQNYHSKVVHLKDPVEVLDKIKKLKQCESNLTTMTIRKQLYNLQYLPGKETASDFCEKFEEIIRDYENVPGAVTLSEGKKRDAFYNAIMSTVPEIQAAEFLSKSTCSKGLSYEMLKMFIIQDEANKKSMTSNEARVVMVAKRDAKERCFECDDFGHLSYNCPYKGTGLQKCYECQQFTTHRAKDCPMRIAKRKERIATEGRKFTRENDRYGNFSNSRGIKYFNEKRQSQKRKSNDNTSRNNDKKPRFASARGRGVYKNVNRQQIQNRQNRNEIDDEISGNKEGEGYVTFNSC